jgi:hypothetical protein
MTQDKVQYREYYVTIDSTDRNRSLWPDSGNFQVKMQPEDNYTGATINRAFKNVRSIEVMNVIYPNTNKVTDQMYLYLCFPEIDGVFEATNYIGNKALAKLIPSTLVGNYISIHFDKGERPKRYYPFHGVRIDKLTIQFRKNNGELFVFGPDNEQNPNPLLQTSITLRIIIRDKVIP